jgi:hypothetical protein
MAEIFLFSDAKWAQLRRERLRAEAPYCGVCFDADGTINDLVPCKQYGALDNLYCAECGEEFPI